ncbi:MAG: hypothetical protein NC225_01665 [Clostridium sp.]|nr:hypothetical protein [Clostridium sp.]MCM1461001.1 hypothetical protein [Bacteroides sp.]
MAADAVNEKKQDTDAVSYETGGEQEGQAYLSMLSKKKFARVIAWICLVIIAALVIATLITGITGSKYFAGCLFLCIIVPVLMYVFLWVGKVLYSK